MLCEGIWKSCHAQCDLAIADLWIGWEYLGFWELEVGGNSRAIQSNSCTDTLEDTHQPQLENVKHSGGVQAKI